MVQDIGCNEEEVSNASNKHGNALAKQKRDRGGNVVRKGKGEVERTKCIKTRFATVINSRLQVLKRG